MCHKIVMKIKQNRHNQLDNNQSNLLGFLG